MADHPVQLIPDGPPETVLDPPPAAAAAGLDDALSRPESERRAAVARVVARFPRFLEGWATLGEGAEGLEAYAYFRVGYHRGLDTLRAAGWRGNGYVRFRHETNRGFLRCLDGLRRLAEEIGEADEAARCAEFLAQLDPDGKTGKPGPGSTEREEHRPVGADATGGGEGTGELPGHARFERAVAAIDAANADDPHTLTVRGERRPKELAHADLVTEWVRRLRTEPSEELLLAARAHHLRRWAVPRSSYPAGRAGYLRWRRDLHQRHAEEVGAILAEAGYPGDAIGRVQDLVAKRGLGKADDPELQCLEDALCLVFVETQFHEVAGRLDDEKMVDVVAKTLRKMSEEGRRHALGLPLAEEDAALVRRAVERLG